MLSFLVALTVIASSATDAKANDAVAAFSQLCVGMFAGKESDIDPSRFSVTKLDAGTAKDVLPDFSGDVWDVTGKVSDVHMLVHYEPTGMCVVQVAEADEASMRSSYLTLVNQTAALLNTKAERQEDRVNAVDGKPATTSMWRFSARKESIMLAVTTYPEAKFMIQHMMTISRVQ